MSRVFCYYLFLVLSVVHFTGCAPSGVEIVSESDEKQYQLGKDYKSQGRMEEALSAFLRVSLSRNRRKLHKCVS